MAADAGRRIGRDARAADLRRLGHELVRLDEDARRSCLRRAQEARRRSRRRPASSTRCAGSASASPRPTRRAEPAQVRSPDEAQGRRCSAPSHTCCSSSSSRSRSRSSSTSRAGSTPRSRPESSGQAQLIATTAVDELNRRPALQSLVENSGAGARRTGADHRRRRAGSSSIRPAPGLRGADYSSRPEISRGLDGVNAQGRRQSSQLDEELQFTVVPIVRRGQDDRRRPRHPERRRGQRRGPQGLAGPGRGRRRGPAPGTGRRLAPGRLPDPPAGPADRCRP